jgi:hypothetical protein
LVQAANVIADDTTRDKIQHCPPRDAAANDHALGLCPGNVYPVHEHEKRKPTRTPTPTPTPTLKTFEFLKRRYAIFNISPICSTPQGLTNSNVDMHFGKIAIQVDHEGHDLFQRVSSGIKAGDQSVTGKDVRETL